MVNPARRGEKIFAGDEDYWFFVDLLEAQRNLKTGTKFS
jgi:hypothetical protein